MGPQVSYHCRSNSTGKLWETVSYLLSSSRGKENGSKRGGGFYTKFLFITRWEKLLGTNFLALLKFSHMLTVHATMAKEKACSQGVTGAQRSSFGLIGRVRGQHYLSYRSEQNGWSEQFTVGQRYFNMWKDTQLHS